VGPALPALSGRRQHWAGWVHCSTHAVGRHPGAQAAIDRLSFTRHGPAAAEVRAPTGQCWPPFSGTIRLLRSALMPAVASSLPLLLPPLLLLPLMPTPWLKCELVPPCGIPGSTAQTRMG
jgi:hypothetical protein